MPALRGTRMAAVARGWRSFDPLTLGPVVLLDVRPGRLFSDAGTTPASVDGLVHTASDGSGNGYNFVQATGGAQPTYRVASAVHYLEFTTGKTIVSSFSRATPCTLAIRLRFRNGVGASYARVTQANNDSFGLLIGRDANNNSTNYIRSGSGGGSNVSITVTGGLFVWRSLVINYAAAGGTTEAFSSIGDYATDAGADANLTATGLTLGPAGCDIAKLLLMPGLSDAGQRANLFSWLEGL